MEKIESGIVIEHIVENSGLINLILKVGNSESKLTFENSKMKVNLGYTVFVRKWAGRLEELVEQGN
jgi:co-chaperonin GroES (HSP10)